MTQTMPPCSVDDCDSRFHYGHGLCQKHYTRWRKTGDPLGLLRLATKPQCAVDDCDRPSRSRNWCKMHYRRWLKTGNPLTVRPNVLTPAGPAHPSWRGSDISYSSAHRRISNAKGLASGHRCVDCGQDAAEWSYDRLDPDELVCPGSRPHPFSVKPAHYQARCVPCHRAFDKAAQVAA